MPESVSTRCESCDGPLPADADACPGCGRHTPRHPDETPTRSVADPSDDQVRPGDRVAGRYLLVELLGRGGFGVVWKAIDQRLGRNVALKLLSGAREAGADDRARFEREAMILASLDHPGIVTVFDAGLDEGRPFFAMKLVRGSSLAQRLRGGRLGEAEALRVASQVAAALAHAHGAGVLHRDIKPSNVLEDPDGRALLADFGISTAGFLPRVTQRGIVMGTLDYLSPEALGGEVSEASDLYSLGVLLYEMLFGQTCFPTRETRALIAQIVSATPAGLASPPVDLSRGTLELLGALLAKDPAARPPSAAAVRDQLDALRRGLTEPPTEPHAIPSGALEVPLAGGEGADREEGGDTGDLVDRLERDLEAIGRFCDDPPADLDPLVERITGFASRGGRLAARLVAEADATGPDPLRLALALSLQHLAREAERRVATLSGARSGVLEGLLRKIHAGIVAPTATLVAALQQAARPDADDLLDSTFVEFDAADPDGEAVPAEELFADLLSEDDLRSHEAALRMVGPRGVELAAELARRPAAQRRKLLRALWLRADTILVEGRGRARPLFEAARSLADDEALASNWGQLFGLFRRTGDGEWWDPDVVRPSLEGLPDEDRRVFGRALLVHPFEPYRRIALDLLRPADFWGAIAHPGTPVPWLVEIWRALRPKVDANFLKVFFACVSDTLVRPGGPDRILAVVEMVKEFYTVEAFHEDVFFRMLLDVDEKVRAEGRRHRLLVDFDSDYIARLTGFLATPPRMDQPVSGWGVVPLPVQRKLARRGQFLRHFVCHPVDRIALECFPHLVRMENVGEFVGLAAINSKLLGDLAKEKRLFTREEARLALVANPKTPAFVVLKHIGFLRKDNLRKLAESRDVNPVSRQCALKLLGRSS